MKKTSTNSSNGGNEAFGTRSQSVLFKSQSANAFFKPQPKIKEILLGKNDREIKFHEDLIKKYSLA